MPAVRTKITEIFTGLGMLDYASATEALAWRPESLVDVEPACWDELAEAMQDQQLASTAEGAWENGRAFLHATDALRGRCPLRIEWRGPARPPGYDFLPVDLRVDHVYLVSCKYRSRILMNVSPAYLFDRILELRGASELSDWYEAVACSEYDALYDQVRLWIGGELPADRHQLEPHHRNIIKAACRRHWPAPAKEAYLALSAAVSEASARRWCTRLPTARQREQMLWRLLRLNSAPYYILGDSIEGMLRLRVGTPWDWTRQFRLVDFSISSRIASQPTVSWFCSRREPPLRLHPLGGRPRGGALEPRALLRSPRGQGLPGHGLLPGAGLRPHRMRSPGSLPQ